MLQPSASPEKILSFEGIYVMNLKDGDHTGLPSFRCSMSGLFYLIAKFQFFEFSQYVETIDF